ncbi:MAG TPA: fibronectin type III domain-containing protein [Steroidobacteraceae bacterium]|nr:fibronectin type III domain-containing protein [Steroidobacteraceae bacterium]
MLRVPRVRHLPIASLLVALSLAACGGGGGDDAPSASSPPPAVPPPPPSSPSVVDTTPPSVPANLSAATPTPTQIQLSWSASTDDSAGVAGYRVYRDGGNDPIAANVTVTNYLDTGLEPNTAHTYTVRAYDAASPANESALTAAVSATTPAAQPDADITPPSVPANVVATATSANSIQITWSAATDASGVASYRVFREGTAVPIAVTSQLSFTDSQLATNTTYTYHVSAVDAATPPNESAQSEGASATTGPGTGPSDTTPPTVPGNVRADARSSTVIRLRWNRSRDASGIAEYRIYRDGASTPVATTDDLEYLDQNLQPNTTYEYTVTAVDSASPANESAHSPSASATTNSTGPGPGPGDIIAPAAPQNFVATTRSSSEIDLGWSASADPSGIANYTIYRDGNATPIATVQTTTFTDTALTPSTAYTYTVRATDGAGNTSTDSASASATTSAAPVVDTTPPAAPDNLVATATSSSEIELTWDAATDTSGIANYTVYRDGNATPIATVQTTGFTDTGLASGSSHTYTVRATDNAGNTSADSMPGTATTDSAPVFDFTPPTVPTDLVATAQPGPPRAIVLTWTASTDASGIREYRIYRDGAPQPIGTSTTPDFTDSMLPPGPGAHTYRVRAVDASLFSNVSANSDPASANSPP